MSNGKIRYLDNGDVMEADAAEVARWYMNCLRQGDFSANPPGEPTTAGRIDFGYPLHQYDDAEYFLHDLLDNYAAEEMRKDLRKDILEFFGE
jgi:hypothetical protein